MLRRARFIPLLPLSLLVIGLPACGRRAGPATPTAAPVAPKAPAPLAAVRPPSLPAPTKERPIAIWRETTEPIRDWKGDTRVAYEKLPEYEAEGVTLQVRLVTDEVRDQRVKTFDACVEAKVPARQGYVDLSAAREKVEIALAFAGLPPSFSTELWVTVGEGDLESYKPLSNRVTVPFVTK